MGVVTLVSLSSDYTFAQVSTGVGSGVVTCSHPLVTTRFPRSEALFEQCSHLEGVTKVSSGRKELVLRGDYIGQKGRLTCGNV